MANRLPAVVDTVAAAAAVADVWPGPKDTDTHEDPTADANLHAINETNVLSGQPKRQKEREREREGGFKWSKVKSRLLLLLLLLVGWAKTTMTTATTTTADDVTCVADNAPGLIHSSAYICMYICMPMYVCICSLRKKTKNFVLKSSQSPKT